MTGRSVSASSGSGMARQDVPANSKVSRYRPLGRPLAHGSYGEVSVAWDSKVNGIVALKKQQAKSETATRELNAYRSLPEHPNVLSILNSFVVDRCLYFAFRYHDSCLWAVWRAARGCLELGEVRRYCKHIFEGLRHMHTHNVCHRDLSLTNLLVSFRDNVVQIADLGLAACAASFALERNVTQLPSRAPEVLLSYDEEEDKEAQSVFLFSPQLSVDLWSAGTVVGALHVGQQLFNEQQERRQLQAMIDFIGPPQEAWSHCVTLPLWRKYEPMIVLREPEVPPCEKLTSSKVCRPLPVGHPAIDLILRLVLWNPRDRITAAGALTHSFFGDEKGASLESRVSADSGGEASVSASGQNGQAGDHPVVACACAGHCGRQNCARRATRNYRQAEGERATCSGIPIPGSLFCDECGCRVAMCNRQRNKKNGRWPWCQGHCHKILAGDYFANRLGTLQNMGKKWGQELRIVAWNTWWLRKVTLKDFAVFDRAFQSELDQLESGASVFNQSACLRLWVSAWLPPTDAFSHWESLAQPGVFASSVPWAASEWADAIRSVGHVSGEASGIQHFDKSQSVDFFGACGTAESSTIGNRLKRKHKWTQVDVWGSILENAFVNGLAVPTTACEFRNSIMKLEEELCKFPDQLKQGQRDKGPNFIRQCVARKFCYAMAKRITDLHTMSWADFAAVQADRGLTSALDMFTCGEIVTMFDMSPFHVSVLGGMIASAPASQVAQYVQKPTPVSEDGLAKLEETPVTVSALCEMLLGGDSQ